MDDIVGCSCNNLSKKNKISIFLCRLLMRFNTENVVAIFLIKTGVIMVDLVKKNQIKYGVIILTCSLLVFGVAKDAGAASIPLKNEEEQVEEAEEISSWNKFKNSILSIPEDIKSDPTLIEIKNKAIEIKNFVVNHPYTVVAINKTKEFGKFVVDYPYKNKTIDFVNFVANYPYKEKTKEFGNSIINYPYLNRTKEFGSSVISYPYKNRTIEAGNYVWTKVSSIFRSNNSTDKVKTDL